MSLHKTTAGASPEVNEEDRLISGWSARLAAVLALTLGGFQFFAAGTRPILGLILFSIHLGFALAIVFVIHPFRKSPAARRTPVYDLVLIALGALACLYAAVNAQAIYDFNYTESNIEVILGTVLIVLVIEGARRSLGVIFPVLVVISLLYALFGNYLPGDFAHQGFTWPNIVRILYFSPQGFWGIMLQISATLLSIFLIFGAVLLNTGGGTAFLDVAFLTSGRTRGGPAKVATVASALFGMITGSSVANVATTGTLTIPLMKRSGFTAVFAGAVEATASTGGMLMPPIMGSGAFIMAEFLGIPYAQIAVAAIVPAVLLYLGLLFGVHLEAVKRDIPPIPSSEHRAIVARLTPTRVVLPFVPLGVLILFFAMGYTPQLAAFWATVVCICLSVFLVEQSRVLARFKQVPVLTAKGLQAAGRSIAGVAVLLASAQIVVSMLGLTGLAVKFSDLLVSIGGRNEAATLVIGMVVIIFMGMGMPSVAVYVLGASVVAPAFVLLGIPALPAHLFVFYFSCIGNITPPICPAAIVASSISKGDWWQTGWTATRLAITGFIIPYMFVYEPVLLLSGSPLEVILAIIPAIVGVFFLSAFAVGYLAGSLGWPSRILIGGAGIMLIQPGLLTDLAGFGLGVSVYLSQRLIFTKKKGPESPAALDSSRGL